MPIVVRPYSEEHVPAVRDFNRRLRAGGAPREFSFPESPVPRWLPRGEGRKVYNEFFLALEDGVVRGTYAVKTQEFSVAGEVRSIGFYHHPYSEGIVDRAYSAVGVLLLRDALRRQPELFALGMGGYDRPLPQMLMAMKWAHFLVPFYFQVIHPGRFLRRMQGLRTTAFRRWMMDLGAFSGAGWLGIHAAQAWRRLSRGSRRRGVCVESVASFGDWADELWRECQPHYSMVAVRDAGTLNVLFPPQNAKFLRLRIRHGSRTMGWAVVAERREENHPQYGDLRVGVILDCLARPEDAPPVMAETAAALAARGVDLITSNQSHARWCRALEQAGFFAGPSNFIFAAPKILADRLQPFDQKKLTMHFTRADGDGLYQYL